MPKPIDITNQRFGLLVAIRSIGSNRGRLWHCQCDCGNFKTKKVDDLRSGNARSCGCRSRGWRHGFTSRDNTKTHYLYASWQQMHARCRNPKHIEFHNYGERGICVCDRWSDFPTFLADIIAEIGERPPDMTLDRVDNDGNYEPGNVKWSTQKEQNANSRGKPWNPALNKTSGRRGVHPSGHKWKAEIRVHGVHHYLGTFDTIEEASKVYEATARTLRGKFYRE